MMWLLGNKTYSRSMKMFRILTEILFNELFSNKR